MNLFTKTKTILRQTEWTILYKKKNNPEGWLEKVIDKNFYQNIIDPFKLMKKSAIEIWNGASFWFFIFFAISFSILILLVQFYQYFPNVRQEMGTLFNLYTPLIVYILSIFFTYFLFAFRMPSAIKQSFVNEDNIQSIIINIRSYIINEKEADLIDKNISDLAELSKRRKIIIRVVTIIIISYIFKETKDNLTLISSGITIVVATFFEMHALGSRAIFINAKLAVREIALEFSSAKTSNKNEESNMKGKILDYSIQNSSGIISGEDGNRYEFSNAEWKSDKAPKANQSVDFEADEKNAKGIYLETSNLQFDTDGLKSKFTDVKNSEMVGNITSQGVQNKFGFVLSLITALALFFPIIEIPFIGTTGALIDGGMGKVLFVLLIVSAFLFYSGMQHKFVKICVSAIAIIVLFQFYDLFSALSSAGDMMSAFGGRRSRDVNLFGLLRFGAPVLILLTLILTYTGLKKNYKEASVKA